MTCALQAVRIAAMALLLCAKLGCGAPAQSVDEVPPAVTIASLSDDQLEETGEEEEEDGAKRPPPEDAPATEASAPPPPDPKLVKARELFKLGSRAYKVGDYAAARQHFEQAHALVPKPQLLFNLVQVALKQADKKAACSYYQALTAKKLSPSVQRAATSLAHVCQP